MGGTRLIKGPVLAFARFRLWGVSGSGEPDRLMILSSVCGRERYCNRQTHEVQNWNAGECTLLGVPRKRASTGNDNLRGTGAAWEEAYSFSFVFLMPPLCFQVPGWGCHLHDLYQAILPAMCRSELSPLNIQ